MEVGGLEECRGQRRPFCMGPGERVHRCADIVAFAIVIVIVERVVVPLFSACRDRVPRPGHPSFGITEVRMQTATNTPSRRSQGVHKHTVTCTPAKRKQTIDRQRSLYTLHKKSEKKSYYTVVKLIKR